MKRVHIYEAVALSLLTLAVGCRQEFEETIPASMPEEPEDEIIQGELLLKLDRETADALCLTRTRSGELMTGNLDFDEICRRYSVVDMERVFEDNGCAERTRKAGLDLWYTVTFEGSAQQIRRDFRDAPGVTHVENPLRIKRVVTEKPTPWTPSTSLSASSHAVPEDYPFNDPMFESQWPLYNDGSIVSTARVAADINILQAWEKTAGRSDIIVAVVDEGVQYTHADLSDNIWSGIGKNFCRRDNETITWGEGHGTHVAGTIAAVNNNGLGISGIAGGTGNGDGVKIMSCQIFHATDPDCDASSSQVAATIKYAADNGAVICQNSWGYDAGTFSDEAEWEHYNRATKEAIDYFITYAGMSPDGETQTGPMAGGVVIFAAGNENSYKPGFPAAYGPCISVAAITCRYEAAWYTNYGETIDIAAPGGGGWADMPYVTRLAENLSTLPGGYGYMSGTSMACPHVSGVAALIIAHFGKQGFTNKQLEEILLSTTRDIDRYQGDTYTGVGTYVGRIGRLVDAGAALYYGEDPGLKTPVITSPEGQSDEFTLVRGESKELKYKLSDYRLWDLVDNTNMIEQSISDDEITLTIQTNMLAEGTYTAELQAYNRTLFAARKITYTVVYETTPTPDPGDKFSVDLYPNPCTDLLRILSGRSGSADLLIRNASGWKIVHRQIALSAGIPVELDVSMWTPGAYSVDVCMEGETVSQTIIKQ